MGDGGSEVKECWYSILGVERTAGVDEIRSAYRKEALKWHPDKIQQSGASPEECERATVRFQRIAQAYEVLGDPTERAWYDKHRNEILSSATASKDFELNVWSFFSSSIFSGYCVTGKGFFKVYGDVFKKIHKKEQEFAKAYGMGPIGESPSIGSLHTEYVEVDAFYKFWLGFATIKDFSWCDEYRISEARNRKERRLMEDENTKIRKRERREFNNAVRELVSFVKKRDKRVQEKQIELQRLQVEKERQLKMRRQQLQEEKLAKARAYKEQDWMKSADELIGDDEDINEDEGSYHWKNRIKSKDSKTGDGDSENPDELYCIVCSKRFRSEKQWNNHEKSKKHIERAFALKQSLLDEDEEADALVKTLPQEAPDVGGQSKNTDSGKGTIQNDEEVHACKLERDDLPERSHDGVNETYPHQAGVSSLDEEAALSTGGEEDDDEASLLDAMMKSHRSRQVAPSEELESVVDERYDEVQGSSKAIEDLDPNGGTEDSDVEDDENEESLLSSMISSHRGNRAVFGVQVGGTSKINPEEDMTSRQPKGEDTPLSAIANDENLSGADDDDIEKYVLNSMLKSRRSQGSEVYEGRPEFSEETGVSFGGHFGADDRSEEETKNSNNFGKPKTRRRSKQERQHLAAKERHDDVLKELSSIQESSKTGEHDRGTSASTHDEIDTTVSGEEHEDGNSSSAAPGKKSKPSQRQKQVKQDVPARLGISDSITKIEVLQKESSKKGIRARGKKSKAQPKAPPSNTCDTCGENFDSRNQLFRHISVTNHTSVNSK